MTCILNRFWKFMTDKQYLLCWFLDVFVYFFHHVPYNFSFFITNDDESMKCESEIITLTWCFTLQTIHFKCYFQQLLLTWRNCWNFRLFHFFCVDHIRNLDLSNELADCVFDFFFLRKANQLLFYLHRQCSTFAHRTAREVASCAIF